MILNMILCFILIMSVLNLIKEGWRFANSYRNEQKYLSSNKRTALTFASIASIITILIFGF
jgi:ABC-type sulfate transport system permease component